MKIKDLLEQLTRLHNLYPDATIYFTDGNNKEWFETFFQMFNVDEEDNTIEMLFDTEEDL